MMSFTMVTCSRSQFIAALEKEMAGFQDVFLPASMSTLPAIWAFKRMCLPDWTILRHKARINVQGGKQKNGVNYWETYTQ